MPAGPAPTTHTSVRTSSPSGSVASPSIARPSAGIKTHLFAQPLRTDEEVCYGQYWTNKWDIYINMHIGCLYKFPARLTAMPIVRSRKGPLNLEILCETLAEIIEILHVAVRPVYTPATVAEVRIRCDKYA